MRGDGYTLRLILPLRYSPAFELLFPLLGFYLRILATLCAGPL